MVKEIKDILFRQLKRLSFLSEAEITEIGIDDMNILSGVMVEIAKLLFKEIESKEVDEEVIEKVIYEKFKECFEHD